MTGMEKERTDICTTSTMYVMTPFSFCQAVDEYAENYR